MSTPPPLAQDEPAAAPVDRLPLELPEHAVAPWWDTQRSRRDCLLLLVLGLTLLLAGAAVAYWAFPALPASINVATIPVRSLAPDGATLFHGATETAMYLDAVLILLIGGGGFVGCLLAIQVVNDSAVRACLGYGLFCAGATMAAGWAIDLLWYAAARVEHAGHHPEVVRLLVVCSAGACLVKFSSAAITALTAFAGYTVMLARLYRAWRTPLAHLPAESVHPAAPLMLFDAGPGGAARPASGDTSTYRWIRGYRIPDEADVIARRNAGTGDTGLCLSGGGVRAAALGLGALQSPNLRKEFLAARYLVSVSGGGYTAGAIQQALTAAVPPPPPRPRFAAAPSGSEQVGTLSNVVRDPATVYLPGTPEEDYLRRHASYIASTPVQLLVAIGLLARNLVLNVALLFTPALLVGVAFGYFYRNIPVTPVLIVRARAVTHPVTTSYGAKRPTGLSSAVTTASLWQITWVAIGVVLALSVLCWLLGQLGLGHRSVLAGSWQLAALAASTVGFVLAVPALVSIAVKIGSGTNAAAHPAAATGIGLGASLLVSLATFAWKSRSTVSSDAQSVLKAVKAIPSGIGNLVLVIATLLALGAAWLVIMGGAANIVVNAADSSLVVAGVVVLAVYLVAIMFLDITTISLHPFYRRKLARTFAVRRVEHGGHTFAVPYQPDELTNLHTYGTRPMTSGPKPSPLGPEIIFAASASLPSGRTPVGSNRVSYTFSGDWIGGPDLGYVSSGALHTLVKPRLQRDLTVQGAVAISGAAIATSVGAQNASWFDTLYTVTGVRLGAWLPNPGYLHATYCGAGDRWHSPQIPRIRRVSFLLRELFGVHSVASPMVQVTDGGFYDNLGLMELFRRRCTRIFCVDASGDSPPAAGTLAATLTLAYEELGVTVEFDAGEPWPNLTPGSGTKLAPEDPLSALNARLSQTGVVHARISYPAASGVTHETTRVGDLYIGKAELWAELPYPLLTYAFNDSTFPHETTANQWFDDAALNAYVGLGRELGEKMQTQSPDTAVATSGR